LLVSPAAVQAQTGSIQGVVRSADDGAAVEGANVWVVGTSLGVVSDEDGRFILERVPPGSHLLKLNRIGFAEGTAEVEVRSGEISRLEISLSLSPVAVGGISVTGSRQLERHTDAPASLSIVSGQEVARSTALSYAESLQRTRGVDTYRSGVINVVPNARGFTTAYNYRLRVLVDNKNAHLIGYGTPLGVYPVAKEDIDRMEVVLGPSSALYGPNAHNGLLHIITKHPRDYPGTTLVTGGGGNSVFFGRLRQADAFQKFAYKINAAYSSGKDWTKSDTVAVDDSGQIYMDNAGEDLEHVKTTGTLYFFPSAKVQVVASLGYSRGTYPLTSNTGRTYGVDASFDYQELRFETPRFFAQAYRSGNAMGDTHAIETKVAAMVAAANAGSPISDSEAISIVRFIEKGYRLNYEAQYNNRFVLGGADFAVIAGIQHEDTRPNTEGTLLTEGRVELSDPVTGTLQLRQTGIYGQIDADLNDRWRLVLAGRHDTHSKYEAQTSPRVAVVYRIPGKGSFRLTYNRAFQAPEIIQMELLRAAGTIPGTLTPIVARGNGEGFQLSDGTVIAPLSPEHNTTFELGYRGFLGQRLFLDVNLYRSKYDNFVSPLTAITDPATGVWPIQMGEHALEPFPSQYIVTYRNFGRVNLNGVDVGVNYQFNDRTSGWLNYSHMNLVDLEDPANDFDGDGKFEELSLNSPQNKASLGIAVTDLFTRGLFGAVSGRWVEAYDFIAGVHRATKAGEGTGEFWLKDRGPLAGFATLDVYLSYAISSRFQASLSATNLFNERLRETVGSPEIRRLILTEFKYTIR
jgi:iron complex outermembrane receptor protein